MRLPQHPVRLFVLLAILLPVLSCEHKPESTRAKDFVYQQFKDSVLQADKESDHDVSNIFDSPSFLPGRDSVIKMLVQLDTVLRRHERLLEQLDSMTSRLQKDPGFSEAERASIKDNIREVEAYLSKRDSASDGPCREKECLVYAEIDKSRQRLYLYVMGELRDSFNVSTGKGKKYETPAISRHPAGPVLVKYTSRKFPGGDYKGLGNMPYAVFVQGGYAIHGTTPGNFAKLGSKASHGCIRLHPDNAKVFNALVRSVGLSQTWVTIKDSL